MITTAAGRYRSNDRRDAEVHAMRWDGSYESQSQIVTWSGGAISGWFDDAYFLAVPGGSGETYRAEPGDWVIQYDTGVYDVSHSDPLMG